MKTDRIWNEIRDHMTLTQPSDSFTDKVVEAVQQQQLTLTTPEHTSNMTIAKQQYMMNALLASAATFLFVVTGVWAKVIGIQSGAFSLTVRETVSGTIHYGIEIINEAIYRL